jgi:hypothetical protein
VNQALRILLVVCLALSACGQRRDDLRVRQDEAIALAKYTQPRLDQLRKRITGVLEQLATMQSGTGLATARGLTQEAQGRWLELDGIAGPRAGGMSTIEKQAEAAAKANRRDDLEHLLVEARAKLDAGFLVIDEDLATVEFWLGQQDPRAATN